MSPSGDASPTRMQACAPAAPGRDSALSEAEKSLLQEVAGRARVPLIIERPEGMLSAGKVTNYLLTFLWWSVWGHFMLPLITLFLWMSGFRRFSEEILGHGGLDALISRLPLYAGVVAMLCGSLIGWALLNWWRFSDRDRRRSTRPLAAATIARTHGMAPEELARWQSMHRLVVLHDSHGRPAGVQTEAGADRSRVA